MPPAAVSRHLALLFGATILGSLLPGALLAQNQKSAARELRLALDELDEKPENGSRVVKAIEQLGQDDSERTVKALLDAAVQIEKLATPIVAQRKKALLAEGGSNRLKRSRYELQNLDDAAEAIATALRGMKTTDAISEMLSRLTDRGGMLPLWLRLQLAARAGDVAAEDLTWRATDGGKAGTETVLAMLAASAALGRRAAEGQGGKWIAAQLIHKNPDIRIAAARALAGMASPIAIELLIDRIDAEQGAVREAVLDALVVLTGKDPGGSTASWRAWLQAEGGPFLAGTVELGRGSASLRQRPRSGHTVSGTYFGIEQTGDSILYVFDNSQSMQAKLGGAGKGPGPITGGAPQTRWDLCRRELKHALAALPQHKRFNLVAFANRILTFAPTMTAATEDNVARAIEWLDGLKLEFQTNVFDAFETAFALAGRGVGDRYYPSEVDTIFFLSDGGPTIANLAKPGIGPDNADCILRAVRRWNALGRVTVHSIGLGLQNRKRERDDQGRLFPAVFLRQLAEQNGGRFEMAKR
ncbi:MAG: hypothetical protein KDC98_25040 [Planctomycetes bacterium]|nr:hypothetical protein [Planctomycetota bacterium]